MDVILLKAYTVPFVGKLIGTVLMSLGGIGF
jgi:hypothetical protein